MIYKESSIILCVDTNDYVYIHLDVMWESLASRVTEVCQVQSLTASLSFSF